MLFFPPTVEGDQLTIVIAKNSFGVTEEINAQVLLNHRADLLALQKKYWKEITVYFELANMSSAGNGTKVKPVASVSLEEVGGTIIINLEKLFGEIPTGTYRFRVQLEGEFLLNKSNAAYSAWTTLSVQEEKACDAALPELDERIQIQMRPLVPITSVFVTHASVAYQVTNLSKDTLVYESFHMPTNQKVLRYDEECNLVNTSTGGYCPVGGNPKMDNLIYPDSTFELKGFLLNRQGRYHLVHRLRVGHTREEIAIYSPLVEIAGYDLAPRVDRLADF